MTDITITKAENGYIFRRAGKTYIAEIAKARRARKRKGTK